MCPERMINACVWLSIEFVLWLQKSTWVMVGIWLCFAVSFVVMCAGIRIVWFSDFGAFDTDVLKDG